MSRYYAMSVEITGHCNDRADAIKAAAGQEWPFDDWFSREDTLTASAENSLCGGESEEQFTERLSLAVWRANEAYCDVSVNATYMEELPCEIHCLDEDDYARLIGERQKLKDPLGSDP
jgi:hypothetical protein